MAFIVKNIDTKYLFACLVGRLDSSTVEVKKIKPQALKYSLRCVKIDCTLWLM